MGAGRWRVPDLALVGVAAFTMNAGLQAYQALFTPFFVHDLHFNAQALGGVESLREVPGFLTVALAAVTVRFRVARLAAFALLLMSAGLAGIAWTHQFWPLVAVGTVWSVGFHLFSPLNNGLVLAAARSGQEGRALGVMGAVGAAGSIGGMALVFIAVGALGVRGSFVPAGLIVLVGVAALLLMRNKREAPRPRLVARRRYSIYYTLTLLDGSRRQIFSTFAVFLLVKLYGLDVEHLTVLLVFNSIVTTLVTPAIGAVIDRYGERRMLALNYACLIPLFAGYALVHNVLVLGVLYCIDNAFFAFGLGINSYLGRIASPEDVTPSLVMGSTVNHIAAVGVPILGGLIWTRLGYQVTFLAGAATCLLSVLAALAIHTGATHAPSLVDPLTSAEPREHLPELA